MSKVHEVLLKHGKITKEQFDKAAAKEVAKDKLKKEDLNKMTKAALIALVNALTGGK